MSILDWFRNKKSREKAAPDTYLPYIDMEGRFVKASEFERIWLAERNIDGIGRARKYLSDNDYIDYKLWEDGNYAELMRKHSPNTAFFRGDNPNLIFHGGCLGCASQRLHGMDRCKGCSYFRADWSLPNLKIEGEDAARMTQDDFDNLITD